MKTLAERLRNAREHHPDHPQGKLTQPALARLAGVSQTTIADIERGRNHGSKHILALAHALKCSADWLQYGRGDMRTANHVAQDVASYDLVDLISVPVLANSGSMGHGELQLDSDFVLGNLPVSREWVNKHLPGIRKVDSLRFVHAYGDSMLPTFSDGDILLVDASAKQANVDGIYVLSSNGQLFIKRVTRTLGGGHQISSDNPSVKDVYMLNGDNHVEIHGRVVWAWNGKRL